MTFFDRRRTLVALALVAATMAAGAMAAGQTRRPSSHEFPPEELPRLSPPDRDEWQQPERIMDALGIYDGNRVADVGAGGGWFTVRLARRVGPNGVVYAEDVTDLMLKAIANAADREGLKNIKVVLGSKLDPQLPAGIQVALMVGVYPYMYPFIEVDPTIVLRNIAKSLAPDGRLGIVEYKTDGAGGPGPDVGRVDAEQVMRDAAAAGLKFRSKETFLRYQYLLIFEK